MRLLRSQCDNLRRICSGSLAETSGSLFDSFTEALQFSSQRHIATSAAAYRFSRVKDPVSHAGAVEGASLLSQLALMRTLTVLSVLDLEFTRSFQAMVRMQVLRPDHTWYTRCAVYTGASHKRDLQRSG